MVSGRAGSSGANPYSAIAAGIAALWGPAHGGANEAVLKMLDQIGDVSQIGKYVEKAKDKNDPFRLMGFGHRVYTTTDPRNEVNKRMAKALATEAGDSLLYPVSEVIEKIMWDEKKLFANADFYAATVYHFMGVPTYLFTPIFVCSRITGWAAHVMEQRANNKLIRPAADYTGPGLKAWVPMEDRG